MNFNNLGARRCCDLPGLGPVGTEGLHGTIGTIGKVGYQGSQGSNGETGAKGNTGELGPAGTAGRDSSYGYSANLTNYQVNYPIQVKAFSNAPINLYQTYAVHISVYIFGLSTNLPYSSNINEQQYFLSYNIQPNAQDNQYIYPILYSNPTISSVPLIPSKPYYCDLSQHTIGTSLFTVITGSFSTFFTYNNPSIIAKSPYNINVFLGNNGTLSTKTVYMNITPVITISVNPLSSY